MTAPRAAPRDGPRALGRRERTRVALLHAADELFLTQGYAATTVNAIAAGAGVSLQTLYLAWGSKRALFEAARDAAASAADLPLAPGQWHAEVVASLAQRADHADAAAYLRAFAALFVVVAQRLAPYWRTQRDAAAVDAEIAADWHLVLRRRRETLHHVADRLPVSGRLPDLTPDRTTDTLWALAGPGTWELLVGDGGYAPEAYERWLADTLVGALCTAP